MSVREKFLLWFSAYREMRDRVQRLEEQLLMWQSRAEDAERGITATLERWVARERELSTMVLSSRMAIQEKPEDTRPETPVEWRERQELRFIQQLKDRQSVLNGKNEP